MTMNEEAATRAMAEEGPSTDPAPAKRPSLVADLVVSEAPPRAPDRDDDEIWQEPTAIDTSDKNAKRPTDPMPRIVEASARDEDDLLEAALDAAIGRDSLSPHLATDPAPDVARRVLTDIGPYMLVERLGGGPDSEVWRAVESSEGHSHPRVLTLFAAPQGAAGNVHRERIATQTRIGAQLKHKGLVRVTAGGEYDGRLFVAREHVEGKSLDDLTRSAGTEGLPLPVVVGIGLRVASVLAYAHGGRTKSGRPIHLVHAALSPRAILVDGAGTVKITDLSVSALGDRALNPRTEARPGKLGYAAPEQLSGAGLDGKADVFALAVILIELVGRRPLLTDGSFALDELEEAARLWCTLRPNMPPELTELLVEMSDLDPSRRPDSAEVKRRLTELAATLGATSPEAELARRLNPAARAPSLPPPAPTDFAEPDRLEVATSMFRVVKIDDRVTWSPSASPPRAVSVGADPGAPVPPGAPLVVRGAPADRPQPPAGIDQVVHEAALAGMDAAARIGASGPQKKDLGPFPTALASRPISVTDQNLDAPFAARAQPSFMAESSAPLIVAPTRGSSLGVVAMVGLFAVAIGGAVFAALKYFL